jgi:hypothetical protein
VVYLYVSGSIFQEGFDHSDEHRGFVWSEMNFWRRPSCHTLSKARSIFRKTTSVHSFRLAWRVVSVWSSRMGLMVERCARKPNCWGGRRLFDSRDNFNRADTFSRIFPRILSREIGQYERGSVGSPPGFGIIIVLAVFQAVGK